MSNEEIAVIIKDAIHDALEGATFPQCALELQRIAAFEEISKKLSIIITGNGDPEKGLVTQFAHVRTNVENFHVETRKEISELKEQNKEKRTREWALVMIGIGMIATAIGGLILK